MIGNSYIKAVEWSLAQAVGEFRGDLKHADTVSFLDWLHNSKRQFLSGIHLMICSFSDPDTEDREKALALHSQACAEIKELARQKRAQLEEKAA